MIRSFRRWADLARIRPVVFAVVAGKAALSLVTAPLAAQAGIRLQVEWPGGSRSLTAAEVSALSRDSARVRFHDGPPHWYSGPRLLTVLRHVGARVDSLRGRGTAQYLVVEALDGYRTVLSVGELAEDIGNGQVLLADRVDGAPLPEREQPFRLIVPADRRPARSVWQVSRLSLQPLPAEATPPVPWLAGCWEQRAGSRRVVEHWAPAGQGEWFVTSRTWRGDSLVTWEEIRVRQREGRLRYEAHPARQAPAVFTATTVSDTLLIFENPAHDFPQRIGYQRRGNDSLLAWIEGPSAGTTRRIGFPYARGRCDPLPYAPIGLFIGAIEEGARMFTPTRLTPFAHPEADGHQFPTALQLAGGEDRLLVDLGRRIGVHLGATLQRYPVEPDSAWPYPHFAPPPVAALREAAVVERPRTDAPLPGLRAAAFVDRELVGFIVDTRGHTLAERGMTQATTMGLDITRAALLGALGRAATLAPARGPAVVLYR